MQFPDALLRGTLIKRYKRFLSDVELEDGAVVTAHCPNPGSMMGLATPGSEVWLSPARNSARKLRFTFEMIRTETGLVGINTSLTNSVAEESVKAGRIPELAGYAGLRREVKYGSNSRIDLLLEDSERPPCYVEVKNVTLKRDSAVPGTAEFPDAVTARGTKHLRELMTMVADGARAVMLFVAQRDDCARLAIAADIDPAYDEAFREARAAGVETICYACIMSPEAIELDRALSVIA